MLSPIMDDHKVSRLQLLAYDRPVLWLDGVSCQRNGSAVLDSATLGVANGELIVIEGSTASGKSTLLEVAAIARAPDRGAVWFAGRNTTTLQRASLPFVRRNIGYCAAEPLLLVDRSVLANIMLALAIRGDSPKAAESAAREALTLVHASDLADRKVTSLSTGQKRLVALARAVAGPPPVVIADEPAALGGEEGRTVAVSALLAARSLGAAVLCGTSDTALADQVVRAGGRRIHLAQGRIVGTPAVELVPSLASAVGRKREIERKGLPPHIEHGEETIAIPPATKGPR
jgi:ABC-type ATPase involved in cell division